MSDKANPWSGAYDFDVDPGRSAYDEKRYGDAGNGKGDHPRHDPRVYARNFDRAFQKKEDKKDGE